MEYADAFALTNFIGVFKPIPELSHTRVGTALPAGAFPVFNFVHGTVSMTTEDGAKATEAFSTDIAGHFAAMVPMGEIRSVDGSK